MNRERVNGVKGGGERGDKRGSERRVNIGKRGGEWEVKFLVKIKVIKRMKAINSKKSLKFSR